ncbi:MAG TPA: universal stress protein [Gemmataceae bacterium]|nr:universal stress protein [Gemmataceae bacterium]
MLPIHNILFPTDFSPRATAAFPVACALARDHDAELLILHVRDMPVIAVAEFGAVPPPERPTRAAVLEKMNDYEPADEKVRFEYIVADGMPGDEIVRTAKERGVDLIVMGTHGRTGLSRLVMGSVAEDVMRKAPCPVLTMKAPLMASEPVRAEAAMA